MQSLLSLLAIAGAGFLASIIALAVTRPTLGTPLFFALGIVPTIAYIAVLVRVWHEERAPRRLLLVAFAFAVAFRIPVALPRVGPDSDMMRYVWDGRVQHLGYNPYRVLPADPAMAATHNDDTRSMPSRRARTPYPPGAQLFFRLLVGLHDSARTMKLALIACDLLTIVMLWRWLSITGRREWLALAYAWNPLVILEIAEGGHIDALGAMWIMASVFWLARRRTALASIAYVLAVATKLLPIVLLPLYWRRVRLRDAAAGAVLMVALYLPFVSGTDIPLGAVPNVVAHIRFNGPLFRMFAGLANPQFAAAVAIGLGLGAAAWARWRLDVNDPAAWAWPMAIALACAPVVYPWYLLYFTPFLVTAATLPLLTWTFTVIPVYVVWELALHGGRWVVPAAIVVAEYAAPCAVAVAYWLRRARGAPVARPVGQSAEPEAIPRA